MVSKEMQTVSASTEVSFYDVVESRRSVRKYDSNAVMTDEEIRELLTTATKAPSSSNLQPWRFIVVTDSRIKEELLPIANNQQQVKEASAVVVVMADLESYKLSEQIYGAAAAAGYMPEDVKNNMIANSTRVYSSLPSDRMKEIVMFDCGLVSMQLMLAAKAKGYDTVTMGGYNRDKLKEYFNIPDRYHLAVMIAIGKAAVPAHPTVRLPLDQIVHYNGLE